MENKELKEDTIDLGKLAQIAIEHRKEVCSIQEAMESMDIQIIDPADLPSKEKTAAPKKKLITAIGFALGCMLALFYSVVLYKKEN